MVNVVVNNGRELPVAQLDPARFRIRTILSA